MAQNSSLLPVKPFLLYISLYSEDLYLYVLKAYKHVSLLPVSTGWSAEAAILVLIC